MRIFKPEDYQQKVTQVYTSLHDQLSGHFPKAKIEHIGSSAIQGALSKGDLDIYLEVEPDQFLETLEGLQRDFGFSIKRDTLRTDSLCMLIQVIDQIDVAIQLVKKGSEFNMFILFRDRMNADSKLVQQYNRLKLTYHDQPGDLYRQKKSSFISNVLKQKES